MIGVAVDEIAEHAKAALQVGYLFIGHGGEGGNTIIVVPCGVHARAQVGQLHPVKCTVFQRVQLLFDRLKIEEIGNVITFWLIHAVVVRIGRGGLRDNTAEQQHRYGGGLIAFVLH